VKPHSDEIIENVLLFFFLSLSLSRSKKFSAIKYQIFSSGVFFAAENRSHFLTGCMSDGGDR